MVIDILNIEPNKVARDLSGKFVLLAGKPKVGKTEFCASAPDCLILAFEMGTNAIPNAMVQPIRTWSDFKLVVRQLGTDAARAKYKTIAIDTIAIAHELCEKHICTIHGVKAIGDIPYGAGYKEWSNEFDATLREITLLGYGMLMTCHLKERTSGDEGSIISYTPQLSDRCMLSVNSLVDIIGVIIEEWDTPTHSTRYLLTKSTQSIQAGSRFKYLAPKIPFGYDELSKAIEAALTELEKNEGEVVTDHAERPEPKDFQALMDRAKAAWDAAVTVSPLNGPKLVAVVENIMGRRVKLSQFTPDQVDLLALMVDDIEAIAAGRK